MTKPYFFKQTQLIMANKTGVVIPVYFPENIDSSYGEELLRDNVGIYCEQVMDPQMICLSVDGRKYGEDVAGRIAEEFGVSQIASQENLGKLAAAGNGFRYLKEKFEPEYIAVVDSDGDHFANELLNFIRAAQHITSHTGNDRVLILGRRISRHRPMGYLRGELEELADRILLDVLYYNAAIKNKPLRLESANVLDEFPDFHSGYKLFSQATAEHVFSRTPMMSDVSQSCYYRHACEAVMVIEAIENDAYLGVVNRSTINEQPISTFGLFDRKQLIADKIIWPCRRLEIPLPFVCQWLANHIPRLRLSTLNPEGLDELLEIRKIVIESLGGTVDENEAILQPLFV